jgi:poly(3-hydroxybutyrate) depolymerase
MSLSIRRLLAAGAVILATAGPAFSQALPNLALLRVRYNSQKVTAKPAGELKAQIDEIDRELTQAARAGRNGEVRRLLAKGIALLANRPWTDIAEFEASLAVRASEVIIDSSRPHTVRLEQIYSPSIMLERPLHAIVTLRRLPNTPAPAAAPGAGPAMTEAAAIELARHDDVPRDLLESPFAIDLDLARIPDGAHLLQVAVQDGERLLGTATLRLSLLKGLDARLRQLDAHAARATGDLQADLRYPADFIRKINRGLVEPGSFSVAAELQAAERIATASGGGAADPFVKRTGSFERHYALSGAGEIMPYRVYVPTGYDGTRPFPLVVALHGLGATEDSFMDGYGKVMPALAEQRNYIAVAPLGFRVDGFYGFRAAAAATPGQRRRGELSELDVMEVLKRIRRDYRIDDARIYLMGHSMGAIGTWALGAKYPDLWAALAPISGLGDPATVPAMRHIPQIVVHGDADPTVNVAESRKMVAALREHGVDHTYLEVAGGDHNAIVVPNLPKVFDFFDVKKKTTATGGPRIRD